MKMNQTVYRIDRWFIFILVIGWIVFLVFTWRSSTQAHIENTMSQSQDQRSQNQQSQKVQPMHITVYVVGAVRHPGLYRLPLDARMINAINLAGGATKDADLQAINLAAILEDGTEIVVPNLNDLLTASNVVTTESTTANDQSSKELQPGEKIPINRADEALLEKLPGIGIKKAQAIIAYRQEKGLYTNIEQLSEVKGIGNKLLAKIEPYISLH